MAIIIVDSIIIKIKCCLSYNFILHFKKKIKWNSVPATENPI